MSLPFDRVRAEMLRRAKQKEYAKDPVLWAEEVLGVVLWSKQKEILRSLVTHKRTAVKSCHGIGKTFISAVASAWWVSTRGAESMVQSSAPTRQQVHSLLWEEIRTMHMRAGLPGRCTLDDRWLMDLNENGRSVERLVGEGKKPADTNIHGFQGTHRRAGVLVILDEGCGVPESIYTGAEAITTAPMDRILVVGNPDDPNTEFGRIFREHPPGWNLITVSAFDTPNFTNEPVPDVINRGTIQREWVEEKRKDWGEDSPRYKAKVLAEFPLDSVDSLISGAAVAAAVQAGKLDDRDDEAPVIAVDVARYGNDSTVVAAKWPNGHIEILDRWERLPTTETAIRVQRLADDVQAKEIRIDGVGVGGGVVDMVAEAYWNNHKVTVVEMQAGAPAPDPRKWYNLRAYWYDTLRSDLNAGNVTLPDMNEVERELTSVYYEFRKAALLLMSKEDMRKKGIKSPDFADAIVMANAPLEGIIDNPAGHLDQGDILYMDPEILAMMFDQEMQISPV